MAEHSPGRQEEQLDDEQVHPDAQAMTSPLAAELQALWERLEALDHGTDEHQHQHQQEMGH